MPAEPPLVRTELAAQAGPTPAASTQSATIVADPAVPESDVGGAVASIAPQPASPSAPARLRWLTWPRWCIGRTWDATCLCLLLAVVAAIPLIQWASLGYLLQSAARLASREPWSKAFPGAGRAGQLGRFLLYASLLWLPVWLVTDLSYSAQLLLPGSTTANRWSVAAAVATGMWLVWIVWAALRGGKLRHFLWPAPLRWLREVPSVKTWSQASDRLVELVSSLDFPRLWWLGARAAVGTLLWIAIPASMMIVAQRGESNPLAVLIGLVGAGGMTLLVLYLPFLQINLAVDNRFAALWDVRRVRRDFRYAPWAYTCSLWMLFVLCIPLYLLRIEATPSELVWAPSLVFVLFMLPAKTLLGAAMGYAKGRQQRVEPTLRHWALRHSARLLAVAGALVYVGALYLAQLVAGQGALVLYLQHALLVPSPLISS